MQVAAKASLLVLSLLLSISACSTGSNSARLRGSSLTSVEGLERVDIPLDGLLELRADHQIGGYDKLRIPKPTLTYQRESDQLTAHARWVFLRLLRESLVAAVDAAGIPIVDLPGECVMEVQLAAIGMNVDIGDDAQALATMTMVMQFRDSASREPLLRYSTERMIESPKEGATHDGELRRGLTEIVEDLDLAVAFRDSGLAEDEIQSRCNGTLAKIGRAARRARMDESR